MAISAVLADMEMGIGGIFREKQNFCFMNHRLHGTRFKKKEKLPFRENYILCNLLAVSLLNWKIELHICIDVIREKKLYNIYYSTVSGRCF